MSEPISLSIVVTSYTMDRLKDVTDLLETINNQTYAHIETVLVIEKSMELFNCLKRLIRERSIHNVKTVFNQGEEGLSAARNLGFKNATGDVIAFVDDDAVIFPNWAAETVRTYSDSTVIGTTGSILPSWEDATVDWFPDEFDWILSCTSFSGLKDISEVRNAFGTNMSFRREAFNSGSLFLTDLGAKGGDKKGKNELVGDETEFSIRVARETGKRILYNPNITVKHKVYKYRITPVFIAKRAYWEGYTKALFKKTFIDTENHKNVLNVERQLLKRIILNLMPKILCGFFTKPVVSWRMLSVTVNATFFVGLGYSNYSVRNMFGRGETLIYEKESIVNEAEY